MLYDKILELEKVNCKLAKLKLLKETLEAEIIAAIGHEYEGQKTYEVEDKAVTIKTDCIYKVDRDFYHRSGVIEVLGAFNPVEPRVTYSVNKKLYRDALEAAPADVRITLAELVEIKPAKAQVKIGARV